MAALAFCAAKKLAASFDTASFRDFVVQLLPDSPLRKVTWREIRSVFFQGLDGGGVVAAGGSVLSETETATATIAPANKPTPIAEPALAPLKKPPDGPQQSLQPSPQHSPQPS